MTEVRHRRGGRSASAVVGMVGAGQLAQMTHQAAISLGVDVVVMSDDPGDAAGLAGAKHLVGSACDHADLLRLTDRSDVVTFDHEGVPPELTRRLLAAGHDLQPPPQALRLAQDKGDARRLLHAGGFPVPAFVEVDRGDLRSVERFGAEHGWPLVLKAPRGGYDGRGVEIVEDLCGFEHSHLASSSPRWLLEARVDIATELSVLVARRPGGWWKAYPVVETVQEDGTCRELTMPAAIPDELAAQATGLAANIADGIGSTGILAVELFVTHDGGLLVNELAARPHNSGHATIDASVTSQFENHLRGILDWPLGDTGMRAPAAATVNLLAPPRADLDLAAGLPHALEDPTVRVHLYRKTNRPRRKVGHVTATADTVDDALDAARRAAGRLVLP